MSCLHTVFKCLHTKIVKTRAAFVNHNAPYCAAWIVYFFLFQTYLTRMYVLCISYLIGTEFFLAYLELHTHETKRSSIVANGIKCCILNILNLISLHIKKYNFTREFA